MKRLASAAALASIVTAALMIAPAANADTGPSRASAPSGYSTGASPYVEADSPAEASKILAALSKGGTAARQAEAAGVQYGPCTLNPTRVYLRKSSGYDDVGFKPYTDCSGKRVTSIHQDSTLYYEWSIPLLPFSWWSADGTWSGGNYGEASYTQRTISRTCNGTDDTYWLGETHGRIVYNGRTYYATVDTDPAEWPCGS